MSRAEAQHEEQPASGQVRGGGAEWIWIQSHSCTDSMDPPPLPLLIPCYDGDYGPAIVTAYRSGLGVEAGEEGGKSVVVLCSERDSKEVVKVLSREGASVRVYYNDRDRLGLESFLTLPQGVLCTDKEVFTGMEAARVIWVDSRYDADTESRSAVLRAVSRLAVVSVGVYGSVRLTPGSVTVDSQFARCKGDREWECKDLTKDQSDICSQ